MYKLISGLLFILILSVTACVSTNAANQGDEAIETNLSNMLGYVPYSFLKEHDIWYGDPGTVKELYGLEDITSLKSIEQMPVEERRDVMNTISAVPVPYFTNNYFQIVSIIGWDGFMTDRAVFHETPPPWGFAVAEGNFDESLIASKLTEQGYEKAEYGSYTYFRKNEDMNSDIMSEIGGQVLAQLNRVAVVDNTIITAPATDIMTGILDAMTGNVTSIIENPACLAVADSLGDVLGAVLITPDRLFQITPATEKPAFDFAPAVKWGTLHEYALIGMGYEDNGNERYWKISLYYDDKEVAALDADELSFRLNRYVFNTHLEQSENVLLITKYEVDEPVIKEYADGATLTIACRYLPDTTGSGSLFTLVVQSRDLLFLAPDPAPYLAEFLTI